MHPKQSSQLLLSLICIRNSEIYVLLSLMIFNLSWNLEVERFILLLVTLICIRSQLAVSLMVCISTIGVFHDLHQKFNLVMTWFKSFSAVLYLKQLAFQV